MATRKLSFSQREGHQPIPEQYQLEELPREFRHEVELCLIKALEISPKTLFTKGMNKSVVDWEEIMRDMWVQFRNQSPATYLIGRGHENLINIIRSSVFHEVLDLIEELANRTAKDYSQFCQSLCEVFEHRNVAYRLIGSASIGFTIVPTTNKLEVQAVTGAFDLLSINAPQFDNVLKHITSAGQLLREGEYGKSISESSSAIEAALRILTQQDKDIYEVSKEYATRVGMHKIMRDRIEKIHHFASDISGGRHSRKQEGYTADRADAQEIFTASCSTIQYLINKQKLYGSREKY